MAEQMNGAGTPHAAPDTSPWLGPALAGTCALLVGVGIARFGYSALIPTLIEAGWFDAGTAAYLGAANLAGYLLGALLGPRLAGLLGGRACLRMMMALVAATFLAATPQPATLVVGIARLLSGLAGGVIMVQAPPFVLAVVPPQRRGLLGGVLVAGVGLGIVLSGPLVGLLHGAGPGAAWAGLGTVCLLLTAGAWPLWPAAPTLEPVRLVRARPDAAVMRLLAAYGLNAVGLVPHMVFLVDYVSRGRGFGVAAGAAVWTLYGVGAAVGPVLAGLVADRIGFRWALIGGVAMQLAAVGAVFLPGLGWLIVSAAVMGAFTPGIVPLVLGRATELVGTQRQAGVWRWATILFAIGQAVGAYGLAPIYAACGYTPLFTLALSALVAALLLVVWRPKRIAP
jgi:predicted MFS family arabinose efflux permease